MSLVGDTTVERCLACEADAVGTVERCLACEADAVGTVDNASYARGTRPMLGGFRRNTIAKRI